MGGPKPPAPKLKPAPKTHKQRENTLKDSIILYIIPDRDKLSESVAEYTYIKKWAKEMRATTSARSLLWTIASDKPAPIQVSRGGGLWGYPFRILSYLQQAGWGLIEVYRLGNNQYAFLMGNVASDAIRILNEDAIPDSIQFVGTINDPQIRNWMLDMSSVATSSIIIEDNKIKETSIDKTN